MKKINLLLLTLILASFSTVLHSQALSVTDNANGSVQLSVTDVSTGDDIDITSNGTTAGRTRVRIFPGGSSTAAFMQVGNSNDQSNVAFTRLGARNNFGILATGFAGTPANLLNSMAIELDPTNVSSGERFIVARNGFVTGAGATEVLLQVDENGLTTIEAKVQASITPPDYVFSEKYKLRSLEEVEMYINENSHLPEIPSAAEFEKDGINLGVMSFDLLKKVEELTLYMIELKKENKELKKMVSDIQNKK